MHLSSPRDNFSLGLLNHAPNPGNFGFRGFCFPFFHAQADFKYPLFHVYSMQQGLNLQANRIQIRFTGYDMDIMHF